MRGRFNGGGTPFLRDFLAEVTRDVPWYTGTGSVYDGWRADEWQRQSAERRKQGQAGFDVDLANLGSGADFVAFQDHLGLPTLSMRIRLRGQLRHVSLELRHALVHSSISSNPGFKVTASLAQMFGLSVVDLGSADILPFHYSYYAKKSTTSSTARRPQRRRERPAPRDAQYSRKPQATARVNRERTGRLEARVERGLRDSSWTRDKAAG